MQIFFLQTAFSHLQGFQTVIHYIFRRTLIAIPTLLVISFIVFAILDLAPNDPTGNLPMTVPPEVREKIRESLGLGQPMHVRFGKWLVQF
ncbi:MAG TPA: ABC transporter substrate-binding protein, partial [Deltaproteobacteria bacterium]|nr:ABC transporter substrate-binding protein [Deltaproteobacteria bacterium]